MKANTISHIKYTKATNIGGEQGEVTTRHIIPTFVPNENIKALDVSDMDDNTRQNTVNLLNEYGTFHKDQVKNIPSFEVWVEQTQGVVLEGVKWRTFKVGNVEELS